MSGDQEWDYWISEIEDKGVNLSSFEIDFFESIQAQRKEGRTLSEKQAALLERIYSDRTP